MTQIAFTSDLASLHNQESETDKALRLAREGLAILRVKHQSVVEALTGGAAA